MAKGRKMGTERTRSLPSNGRAAAYCSSFEGGVRVDGIAFGQDNPQQSIEESFKKARYWYKYNSFVRMMTLLKFVYFNYGFAVTGTGAAGWYKDNASEADRYVREAWRDWMVLDNALCVWRKSGGRALVYPPEDCFYSDKFGIEQLEIRHGIPPDVLRQMLGLNHDERTALAAGNKLVLTHGAGVADRQGANLLFGFDLVKRERLGQGLAWPGMAVLFQACSQFEGMEVGDALLGNSLRTPIEQHQLGHETRYGPMPGGKQNFITKDKALAVENAFKGKKGPIRLATNFDHKVLFPAPDPKQFDGKRYDGLFRRLESWAMPLAQMIFAKTLNPYLIQVFGEQARGERAELKRHFETVFREVMDAPKGIQVVWSDKCFRDTKLMADLLKFAMTAGPLSQTTFLKSMGEDEEVERRNKAEEAKLPEGQTSPIYDPHHGPAGANAPAGRKRGTADGQGQ